MTMSPVFKFLSVEAQALQGVESHDRLVVLATETCIRVECIESFKHRLRFRSDDAGGKVEERFIILRTISGDELAVFGVEYEDLCGLLVGVEDSE